MNIGVLGGGQLGRMLALAGIPLGHRFVFLDPSPNAPAADVGRVIVGAFDDPATLAEFMRAADVVTFEFENVPAPVLDRIADGARIPVRPAVQALRVGQDRLLEKTLFREVGLATPEFAAAGTLEEFRAAVARVGAPCVAKTRRMGYDGKGQAVLRDAFPETIDAAWRALDEGRHGAIVESFVPFTRELSILGVRGAGGEVRFYPLVQNLHAQGILRRSVAPAPGVAPGLQAQAERHAASIMERLGYVGVMAIEFFEVDGGLLGNEMAPRVHNSGHWTIEGSATSQFENHVRAVAGMPLGSTAMTTGAAVMLNLVGSSLATAERTLADGRAKLHWYGKAPRPGRKVGHVTVRGASLDEASAAAAELEHLEGVGRGPAAG